MIEPAELGNFFAIFFSSALVIVLGALYALLFAFSHLKNNRSYLYLAYLSYGGLVVSISIFSSAANLLNHSFWISIIALMLVGYFFAPILIWHLCIATHKTKFLNSSETNNNHQIP